MIRGALEELKQRHVVRVAGIYAVGGWAVFQVTNTLFSALDFPRWTITTLALLFLAGFPIAVLAAWFLEITPDGVRWAPKAQRKFGVGPFGWLDWLVAGVVALILTFSAIQLATIWSKAEGGLNILGRTPKSVAVLPFASFSQEQADLYFADGLTEEVINSLAQSPELKVAGRTSSFYFKGKNEDLREVGRKLGVAHVLEGSVRRAGDRLRVTAQLIKVDDGFHIWSETYDRTVNDALAIQTEVAETVAEKLRTTLEVNTAAHDAASPEHYRMEITARALLRTEQLQQLKEARELFGELRKEDPENAHAQAGFAQTTILLAQNFLALPFDQARRESEDAVKRALAIAPDDAESWLAKGTLERVLSIRTGGGQHTDLALQAFRRAYEIDSKSPENLILLGRQLTSHGQVDQAMLLLRKALEVDPLSRPGQEYYADALANLGRYDEARRAFEGLINLYPDYTSGKATYATLLINKLGRLDEAALLLDDPKLAAEDPLNAFLLANALANMGVPGGAEYALSRIPADSPARAIADGILLQLQNRPADVLRYAAEEEAKTREPLWTSVRMFQSALIGEYNAARAALPNVFPELAKNPPEIEGHRWIDAILVADLLNRTGSPEQGKQILENVVNQIRDRTAPDDIIFRALALTALGRRAEAVQAFALAADRGWRQPIEFDFFLRIERYPMMQEIARDPGYRAVIARVEADNRRMRDAYLKARAAKAPPVTKG